MKPKVTYLFGAGASCRGVEVGFAGFEGAYKELTEKLRPMVHEKWILKG